MNHLSDAETGRLRNVPKRSRPSGRDDSRAPGKYQRKFLARAGEVKLRAPMFRKAIFEAATIKRRRRSEQPVEGAMIEMHLAGVSVRRVEFIPEALWAPR